MRGLLPVLLLALSSLAVAQPYGNEWVNYDQPYFKIPITEEGIYRIGYEGMDISLAAVGLSVSTVDPRNIQIFRGGVEQPLHIVGEADGNFDFADHIEFYARGNDGFLDDGLYMDSLLNANPYHSMINDTINYILTWNNSTNNARYQIETDTDHPSYTPSPYIFREYVNEVHSTYWRGQIWPSMEFGSNAEYTGGEGFYGSSTSGGSVNWTLNTAHRYTSGPDAQILTRVVGYSQHEKQVTVQAGGQSAQTVFDDYDGAQIGLTVPAADLGASTTTAVVSMQPVNSGDLVKMFTGSVKIKYPKTPNWSGIPDRRFSVPDNPDFPAQLKSRIDVTGFGGVNMVLYDFTGRKRMMVSPQSGTHHFLIPDIGVEKQCYLAREAETEINVITQFEPAGRDHTPYLFDLGSIDPNTDFFIVTNRLFLEESENYADYRNSSGHTAITLDFEELVTQFGGGVPMHPMAIRNLVRWALDSLNDPKHLFIIGKSVSFRTAQQDASGNLYSQIKVPSFGQPPSDHLFAAYLGNGNLEEPGMAVGRLAAVFPQHVTHYLQKVIDYEQAEIGLWQKKGLHFSGGGIESEVTAIRNRMDSYKATYEDTLLGGSIQTFQKTSSEPFQITQVDSIIDLVNNGTQLLTFFGHGSSVGFDVSIDEPSVFDIQGGKYPFMHGISCNSGDIHLPVGVGSISESWVLEAGGGAIGFLAAAQWADTDYLHNYTRKWYKNLALDNYAQSIGQVINATIGDNAQSNNKLTTLHNLSITLHGDPSIRLSAAALPDLKTSIPEIYTVPTELSTVIDSFQVNVIISNLGMAFSDSFFIEISHTLPNGVQDTLITIAHPPVYYLDTLKFWLHIDPFDGVGVNTICVSLDNSNIVDELSEFNNDVCIRPFIISPDIVPIYPYEFAVMPDQGITLKASTGNPFVEEKTYRLELDTTDLFNSPLLQSTTVTQSGGVVEWTPTLLANMPDSTVYFWRASLDSATHGEYEWRETSFQYIVDKYGWGQAHFFQYKKDGFVNLSYDRPEREFDFFQSAKQLQVNNWGTPTTLIEGEEINYFIDNGRVEYLGCTGNIFASQLLVGVIDACSLEEWRTSGTIEGVFYPEEGDHGQMNCRPRPEGWYQFLAGNPTSMNNMVNFIENVVPDSNYIFMLSWLDVDFSALDPTWLAPFQAMGATAVDTTAHVPYIFFGKKGDPSQVIEVWGQQLSDQIQLQTDVTGCQNFGNVITPYIGPTSQWNSLHLRWSPQEDPTQDSLWVDVIGVTPTGQQEVVMTGLNNWSHDILQLDTAIDAALYPRLRLSGYLKDDSLLGTPPQLDRWQVLFDGVPEAALNPQIHLSWSGDSLLDGQSMLFSTAITNVSEFDMDSLLVHYWIISESNQRIDIPYPRQGPLLAGQTMIDTVSFNPQLLSGISAFWVEVNPVPVGQSVGYDQLEQYHFNNLGSLRFDAVGDNVNPIMDVTFDGVHILDGDIVSAKPFIVVELDDESQYRLLDDSTDFQILVSRMGSSAIELIDPSSPNINFVRGEAPRNKARIEWQADFPIDGIYELSVNAVDKSGNQSGEFNYKISFEVINRSTITEIMNWPNPFSTKTHFAFTLTGSELPTYFKIQIMTISGKVVREITMGEMGPMNIGRNITQYAWDGKDTYGDQLGNGVYLYRVVSSIAGEEIEHRESGADQWIEHSFGKMMLIR